MRNKIVVILLLIVFSPSMVYPVQSKVIVTIPSGTPVLARIVQDIHSSELEPGQRILMVVDKDVVVDGHVVINNGAQVVAEVIESKDKTYAGIPGKVQIALRSVRAVDEQDIFLSGSKRAEGESKMVLSIALGLVLCPLFLLMKGKEGVIRAGQTLPVYTAHKAEVEVKDNEKLR